MLQEDRINRVLNSLEGMQKAAPPEDLYAQIVLRMKQEDAIEEQWKRKFRLGIAVAASLFLAVNVLTWVHIHQQQSQAISMETQNGDQVFISSLEYINGLNN